METREEVQVDIISERVLQRDISDAVRGNLGAYLSCASTKMPRYGSKTTDKGAGGPERPRLMAERAQTLSNWDDRQLRIAESKQKAHRHRVLS